MTKTVSSECSSLSDIDYDPIISTFAKLRVVISQEASLRKELDNLFVKRTEEAHLAVQNAQNHLEMVKTQEVHMREIIKIDSATANEMYGSASNASPGDTDGREQMAGCESLQGAAMVSMVEAEKIRQEQEECDQLEEARLGELEMDRLAKKDEENHLAAQDAAIIAAIEARRQDEAEQRQLEEKRRAKEAEGTMQEATKFDEPPVLVAPKKKKKGKKPKETPAALMEEPSSSPARSIHAFELFRFPARLVRGLDSTRSKEEEDRIAAQKAIGQAMEGAAMATVIKARQVTEARGRQREEAEIADREAEKLKYEQEVAAELRRIQRERDVEEYIARLEEAERLEQTEDEMCRIAQEEAQLEQCQLMEEAAEAERHLKQLVAEESEMAEQDRLEEACLIAEAAANERPDRARYGRDGTSTSRKSSCRARETSSRTGDQGSRIVAGRRRARRDEE